MIQHAHGEGGVKAFHVGREVFHAHREQIDRSLAQIPFDRQELEHEQQPRVDADHLPGPRSSHAPAMVAGAAAHIQNGTPRQIRQMRCYPVPFPV